MTTIYYDPHTGTTTPISTAATGSIVYDETTTPEPEPAEPTPDEPEGDEA